MVKNGFVFRWISLDEKISSCLFVCSFVYLFVSLFVWLFVCLFVYLDYSKLTCHFVYLYFSEPPVHAASRKQYAAAHYRKGQSFQSELGCLASLRAHLLLSPSFYPYMQGVLFLVPTDLLKEKNTRKMSTIRFVQVSYTAGGRYYRGPILEISRIINWNVFIYFLISENKRRVQIRNLLSVIEND